MREKHSWYYTNREMSLKGIEHFVVGMCALLHFTRKHTFFAETSFSSQKEFSNPFLLRVPIVR